MDIEKIERLKNQSFNMNLTFINIGEALVALCEIAKDLGTELNEIQTKLNDQAAHIVKQDKRKDRQKKIGMPKKKGS